MNPLFVIVGAGASHGCAPEHEVDCDPKWRPPLVKTLFSTSTDYGYHTVLARYGLAQLAAAELRSLDESVAIEEVLRDKYRDAESIIDRRIFRSIAPYLQELLHTVSDNYTRQPVFLHALVAKLLRLPEVVFITLNYDLILDRVLAAIDPFIASPTWYVNPERSWSLIKLHGSVNWSQQLLLDDAQAFFSPPAELPLGGEIIIGSLNEELHARRGFSSAQGSFQAGQLRYPVLSVPQGSADELACPPHHVEFLREKLAGADALDLLFLGYSAYDAEVVALLKASGKEVRSLLVVDHDLQSAHRVLVRLEDEHRLAPPQRLVVGPSGAENRRGDAHDGDFGSWVSGGGLDAAMGNWG